jgi:hypothetical protein
MRKDLKEKLCFHCKEVLPIDNFTWVEERHVYRSYCHKCQVLRQRARILVTTNPDMWTAPSEPNTYHCELQRTYVAEFLTKVLGWSFNSELGIWYKLPLKDKNGIWNI